MPSLRSLLSIDTVQARSAVSAQPAIAGGYTRHNGGPCPVPAGDVARVLLRNGATGLLTYECDWSHKGSGTDIVGWKRV